MPLIERIEASLAPYLPKGVRRVVKDRAELALWKEKASREGKLGNDHYEYFYTEFFGLSIDDYRGKSIIDIGCGPCGSLEWAEDANVRVGLDSLADEYRTTLGVDKHKMRYVAAPVEAIPYAARRFDFVSCFNALDHVEDLHEALSEIHRVLKRDGTFLLIVEVNHEPTVTEPVTISERDLQALLGHGFELLSWRTWPVPQDHNLYGAMRAEPTALSDGRPAIVAAEMAPRAI